MRASRLRFAVAFELPVTGGVSAPAGPVASPTGAGSESVTSSGEIEDPPFYLTHGSRGPERVSRVSICARGGPGLAFSDDATCWYRP